MKGYQSLLQVACRALVLTKAPSRFIAIQNLRFTIQQTRTMTMVEGQKLLVDVDTGVDDAQALMMGLAHSGSDIIGVTCVAGNTDVDQVVINTLRVLEACDRTDVPVYRGAAKSLLGTQDESCYHHGDDGMGGASDKEPPSTASLSSKSAAVAMVDIVNKYPGEVTLVALAPLTNVALALRLDPAFGSKLKNVIIMGGNIQGRGNVTPSAEFNFITDVEAAHVTLHEITCPITLVSWDLCSETVMDWAWFDGLMAVRTKRGIFHRRINEYTEKRRKEVLKLASYISCDPIAMAVALDPTIITQSKKRYCAVELNGQLTRGQMVVDWREQLKNKANVDLVLEVDLPRLQALYEQMVQ